MSPEGRMLRNETGGVCKSPPGGRSRQRQLRTPWATPGWRPESRCWARKAAVRRTASRGDPILTALQSAPRFRGWRGYSSPQEALQISLCHGLWSGLNDQTFPGANSSIQPPFIHVLEASHLQLCSDHSSGHRECIPPPELPVARAERWPRRSALPHLVGAERAIACGTPRAHVWHCRPRGT